jgi:hypothetical protein
MLFIKIRFFVHYCFAKKKPFKIRFKGFVWSHLGSNQGPPDYESGALTS